MSSEFLKHFMFTGVALLAHILRCYKCILQLLYNNVALLKLSYMKSRVACSNLLIFKIFFTFFLVCSLRHNA